MTIEPGASAQGIIARVQNILLKPQSEWDVVAGEPADLSKLYMGYVLPLAAIAAICAFIGTSIFGVSMPGFSYRVPIMAGVVGAVLQVAMGLLGVYVLALITNALAPNFGSQQDIGQAHKLSAYSSTAGFVAGVFAILPPLSILAILGLYSLFLLYIGLPRLMKTPEDKRVGYLVTIIVVAIVVWIVIGVVVGAVRTAVGGFGGAPGFTIGQSAPANSGEVKVELPGGGTLDMSALEQAASQAAQGGSGAGAVDPARLQAQLPQSLPGGFTLTRASSGAAMGMATAEGEYENGNARLRVEIVQLGAMGGIAGMAQGMNVQQNSQTADGYTRVQTIDGRVYNEEADTKNGAASFGVIGRGVSVTASGSGGVSVDQARAAVEVINVQRLEREFGA